MKLSTRQDVDAPPAAVFARFSDFAGFEDMVRGRGAEVERLDAIDPPAAGMAWRARFQYNGKPRELHCELTRFDPEAGYEMRSSVGGLLGHLTVDLAPLPGDRTQVKVGLELRPTSFTARMLLQSMKLAKGRLETGFRGRVEALARSAER